jgi:chromosome segregation and condensation protein ScpB
MASTPELEAQETWINIREAAELTGYNREYIKKLMMRIAKRPENQREIKLRKRSFGYELWLPDLLAYIQKPSRGPQPKRK